MAENLILTIDQGTSSTKAVVFDTRGRIVARGSAPLASLYPSPGFVEQEPAEICRSAREAVKRCLEALDPRRRADIVCCGISNQRETFVLWDETGCPLGNAVVWQCRRSVDICKRISGTSLEADIQAATGLIADPYFSGTKLMWLAEHDMAVRQALAAGRAWFGTVDAWLLYTFTGGTVHATDYTNACRTLLFNIDKMEWDMGLVEKLGLTGLRLPHCQPSAHLFGTTDLDGLLPRRVPLTALVGDSHASAFGQACFEPGSAKVTMGTGCSVLMNTGRSRGRASHGMMATLCWSAPCRTDYALEGIIVSCGATLTWLRDQLGLYRHTAELEQAARRVPSSAGVYLVPAFAGLGAPHWRMDAAGTIQGLTFAAGRDHILRAAQESIALQIKEVLDAMAAEAGVAPKSVAADGGISANAFVMQLTADLLGVTVTQRGIEEVSALGAACLAGLGAGLFTSLSDIAALQTQPVTYRPGDNRDAAAALYTGWQAAVARV